MSQSRSTRRGGWAPKGFIVWGALAGACQAHEAPPPFEAEYATERLNVATGFAAELCQGNLALFDAHLAWLAAEVDGPREPAWLRLYPGEVTPEPCASIEGAIGCWIDPVAYATEQSVSHELVHSYMWSTNEAPLSFLREGFAVMLQGTAVARTAELTADELLGPIGYHPAFYQSAGHFSRWLVLEFGMEAAVQLYAGTAAGMTEVALGKVMQDVLNASLEEVLSRNCLDTR